MSDFWGGTSFFFNAQVKWYLWAYIGILRDNIP